MSSTEMLKSEIKPVMPLESADIDDEEGESCH